MAPPESLSPSGVALACVLRNATSDNDVVATAAPDSITNEEETSYVAFRNWISSGSPDKMKPGPPTNACSILCLLFFVFLKNQWPLFGYLRQRWTSRFGQAQC